MRSSSLVIPIAVLTAVILMLPGISFCLSSSITSNYNSISSSEVVDYGLYKDLDCKQPWGEEPAFGKGIVQINEVQTKDSIVVSQSINLGGSDFAYIKIPVLESGEVTLSVRIIYSTTIALGNANVTLSLVNVGNTSDKASCTILWGSSSGTVTVKTGAIYSITAVLDVYASNNVSISSNPLLDFDFIIDSSTIAHNYGNVVNFSYKVSGIEIESDKHVVQGPISVGDIAIDNSTIFKINDSSGHFSSKVNDEDVTIATDESHEFYIGLDLGKYSTEKKMNTITIQIINKDTNEEILNKTFVSKT